MMLEEPRTGLFFFQAEDGIRDHCVTGVQTCALPIYSAAIGRSALPIAAESARFCANRAADRVREPAALRAEHEPDVAEIGRASCRERVYTAVLGDSDREKEK